MTSSNGTISRVTGPLCGEFTGPGEFPTQRPVPLICIWINGWVNNREAGDLRRYRGHYDVNVMFILEKHNRHPFLALTGEICVVCWENLKKIDRVMAVPHCFNPFPVAFGALLWVSLSYDVTSVLMQSTFRTSESVVLCLYVQFCLVVTKKCKYGEIKLCGNIYLYMYIYISVGGGNNAWVIS